MTIRRTWVDIDLAAFERNLSALAAKLPARSRLMAVLKADAYGHGAVELARRCRPETVAMIATALLEEAQELKTAGIGLPILVLGPLHEEQIAAAADAGIAIGVIGPEELEAVARVASSRDVLIHLKLDTGMGRMGVLETDFPRVADLLRSAPRIRLAGIYTHFASADDVDDPFTFEQIARFESLVDTLREAGITAPMHHLANSAAVMRGLIRPGDYVRTGVAMFGAATVGADGRLEPVMRWRTEIARLKELPAGEGVGYGRTFVCTRPSIIATVPVGYADGYNRRLSNCGEVLVRGKRAPVVGRISMDLVTIDVTDVDGVVVGDEVVLLGRQGDDEITAEELGGKLGTISYEVFCAVGARVPRVFRDGDTVVSIRTRFDR